VKTVVEKLGGRVEKFTGDGIFAYFGLELADTQIAVQSACDCAFEVRGLTQKFFARGEVAKTCLGAGIQIEGCRTVLHFGKVMHGQVAGMPALVGRNVVALFRACDRNELFDQCPVIMSEPFMIALNQPQRPAPIAKAIRLDDALPPMTVYPHPAFVPQGPGD
jgi:class 3 adenylate cyclase